MNAALPLFNLPAEPPQFDGRTFDQVQDGQRLNAQLVRVWNLMRGGSWHTLAQIAEAVHGSEAGVSARLRDFRKPKFGSHTVQRMVYRGGLHHYRLIPNGPLLGVKE